MADTHGHAAHGPSVASYMVVFGALSVFTAISFLVNLLFGLGSHTGAAIIMVVAVCKAALVGAIFMHLKWDWSRVFFIIVPISILATMMMLVLMPDIVLAWSQP
jgi:caa(3)-type oxidase subunit IV